MLTYFFLLILLMPLAFLPAALEGLFSPDELAKMGIRLENLPAGEPL